MRTGFFYIIFFSIATIIGFSLAHLIGRRTKTIKLKFSIDFIERLLQNYKWIMWLNFFGGILRIIVMVSMIGFSFSNIFEYRLAANMMMMIPQASFAGWVFKITAYINIFAMLYVAFSGLRAGLTYMNRNDSIKLFILFAPVQLATGGRLFILYFIIFYNL